MKVYELTLDTHFVEYFGNEKHYYKAEFRRPLGLYTTREDARDGMKEWVEAWHMNPDNLSKIDISAFNRIDEWYEIENEKEKLHYVFMIQETIVHGKG